MQLLLQRQEMRMFGMGPLELVFALVPLMLGAVLAVFVVRLAVAPLNQRLDRIIELLSEKSRSAGD